MVKAKEFWEYLCDELDYRFFSGVPCEGLKPLYDTMNIDLMYYVPAVNENVALGMSSGAQLAGVKSAILLDIDNIYSLYSSLFNFNTVYKVPFLIIAYKSKDSNMNLEMPHKVMSKIRFKPGLKKLVEDMETEAVPGILVIEEGILE